MRRKVLVGLNEIEKELSLLDKRIAFDTETTSLNYSELDIEGISICDGVTTLYIDFTLILTRSKIIKLLQKVFNQSTLVIAHNIVFDLKVLHKIGIRVPEFVELFDTMVADHLLNENRSHKLKDMARDYLGVETVDYENAHKDKALFYEYALNDAEWTWKIAQVHKTSIQAENQTNLFRHIEMPFMRNMLEMELNGVLIDTSEISNTTTLLHKEIEDLTVQLHELINAPYNMQLDLLGNSTIVTNLNFNSTMQLTDILFNKLKLKVIETTPGGKPSVGKKTIQHYLNIPFVETLNKYKIANKLLNAFFKPLPELIDSDNRVRPQFRDIGTKTGRLSCSKPNLQQLPKLNKAFPIDTRKCFIVPEGYKMIACDYSGQELRVLTEITQEPILIDTFNKGKDLHLSTANDFFNLGIPEEELYTTHAMYAKNKKVYYSERNKAKVINFGMAYGKGAYGFSKDFDITEEEAQEILNKYFAALPKVKEAIELCHRQMEQTGEVVSLTGRKRRFQGKEVGGKTFYPGSAYRQSFNFLIQGYSADMMRMAMNKVRKNRRDKWNLTVIMTVHDEAVYQVKEEYAEEAAAFIKEQFETAVKLSIPLVADVQVGNTYSEVK